MIFTSPLFYTSFLLLTVVRNHAETITRLEEVFRDDFTTDDHLNASKWNTADRHTASQTELSYYLEDNVGVKNEYLILHCEQEQHMGCNYTSARVDTDKKFTFLYGEVEWRAKLPGGPEFYTGLWLNRPDESDSTVLPFEFRPPAIAFIDSAGIVSQRLFHGYNHMQQVDYDAGLYSNIYLAHKPLAFHVYKVVWTNASVEWYIDGGLVYWVRNATKVPRVPLQIVMNIVVGGPFCDGVAGVEDAVRPFAPRQMLVDWVVVRQKVTYAVEQSETDYYGVEYPEEGGEEPGERSFRVLEAGRVPGYFAPVVGVLLTGLVVVLLVIGVYGGLRWKMRRDRQSFFSVYPQQF